MASGDIMLRLRLAHVFCLWELHIWEEEETEAEPAFQKAWGEIDVLQPIVQLSWKATGTSTGSWPDTHPKHGFAVCPVTGFLQNAQSPALGQLGVV